MTWRPSVGLNLILGGGDVGKTTILEAIALLFSPTNAVAIAETDFTDRDYEAGFEIEAVIAGGAEAALDQYAALPWPWMWDGENAVAPPQDGEQAEPSDEVHVVRVRGGSDLELQWDLVQPNGDQTISFSTAMRRGIGVIRLMGGDRNDRDLRLVYGSALDRLLNDTGLRARIGQRAADADLNCALGDDGWKSLSNLEVQFEAAALPTGLSIGLTSSQGLSIGALIGLLAKRGDVNLPLSNWGAGTRRLSALEIASALGSDASLRVIDEIERGLEPYRLRALLRKLIDEGLQCFVTTHSAVAIGAASKGRLWHLSPSGQIGELNQDKIIRQQRRDPETFLARTAVIAEGKTELGFMTALLEEAFGGDPRDHGIRVCYGEGNEATLALLEALLEAGLTFAGFADNEGTYPDRWARMKGALRDRLFQWPRSCTEDEVISLVDDTAVVRIFEDPDGSWNGQRARTVADRLGSAATDFTSLSAAANEKGVYLKDIVIAAATGKKDGAPEGRRKEWGSHEKLWFKSEEGGRELFDMAKRLGIWETLAPCFFPLVNSLLAEADLAPLETVQK